MTETAERAEGIRGMADKNMKKRFSIVLPVESHEGTEKIKAYLKREWL